MKKSFILFNLLLLLVVLYFGVKALNLHSEKHLNVIIISIDALRADQMSLYGNPNNTTPNIDNWARKATVFTNLRTVVPMTQPSFTGLFTGLEPFNSRVISNSQTGLNPNTNTLMSVLRSQGFLTAAFTANLANIKNQFSEFNYYLYKSYYYDNNGSERYVMDPAEDSSRMTRDAEDWLDKNANQKFFLWFHLMDVHTPYYPADKYKCEFDPKYCNEILGKSLDQIDKERAQYQMCQENPVSQDRINEMKTIYDGGVAQADFYVGQILAKIKSLGLDKNSIIVLLADHGEGLDHNYFFNHRAVLYDSAVHIPLVIYDPLVSAYNKRSDINLENTDIMPTILDLIGSSGSNLNVDGKSFSSSIAGSSISNIFAAGRKYVYSVNSDWTKYSIYDGRYKYIYSLPQSCIYKGQTEELYDIKSDPNETENLVSSNTNNLNQLKNQLFSYLSKYNLPPASIGAAPPAMQDGDEAGNTNNSKEQEDDIRSLGY